MTTKIGEATGGGYEKRGQRFIRVTVGPQKRQAQHAPWAASLEDAIARAKLVQSWVNRLRAAGQGDFVEKIIELGAAAPDEATLAELVVRVNALAGGNFERARLRRSSASSRSATSPTSGYAAT
jgi:hypothetical protein